MFYRFQKSAGIYLLLGIILAFLATKVFFLKRNFETVVTQNEWVTHTASVLAELELTISSLKDAETSVRGYLLTSREESLDTYRAGIDDTYLHLNEVKSLTADNQDQQKDIDRLKELIDKRLEALENLVIKFATGGKDQIKADLGVSRSAMQLVRKQVDMMKKREGDLLARRSEASKQSQSSFYILLFAANIIIATVLLIVFSFVARVQARTSEDANRKDFMARLASSLAGDISLKDAGNRVLEFLSSEVGVLAGQIYVNDQGRLQTVSSYGIPQPKVPSGLVESAFSKGELYEASAVPDDYWQIGSGLGSRVPTSLTFLPFKFQNQVLGVAEVGTFAPLNESQKSGLKALSEIIGVGLNSAYSRSKLKDLLEMTQQQSEELQTQQEELRSTNEELEQQARAMESQQQALSVKNDELQGVQTELEERARDLERSSQYKSEFLAKMSHELRTPLNGLLILSTLLMENKEKTLTDQQRQFASSINTAGNDLLNLINDILDLSKIEAKKLALRIEKFSVEEICNSLKASFEPQAKVKNLELKITVAGDAVTTELQTDRQRLEQILRNFLSNALKFTEKGSIELRGEMTDMGGVRFSVIDSGIGVPLEKQAVIFDAFEQADSSVSRKYGGTGLGLTISKELAELLGGKILVESIEGKGSKFSVEIPAHLHMQTSEQGRPVESAEIAAITPKLVMKDQAVSPQQTSKANSLVANIPKDEKSILIVEDDDAFRISVAAAAKSYGFHPIEVGDGELALAVLKVHAPSAVLLDIKLPGISGLGILEMMKQMPHLRHIPVHMISGLEYQQNALRMGALGYLTKPVTTDKVRAALSRIEKLISNKVRRLLIIEDDAQQSFAVSGLVAGPDLEVSSAHSGSEAIEKIKAYGFDCIILDLSLPDISGFELLKQLEGLDISLPPIVIYTGKDLSEEEERYLRKFSESIIIKGARSPERLLDEVNLFLHRVEALLPESTRTLLSNLRSQEKAFEGKTVLIVDDDIRNVFALTSALESKGLKVEVARNGIEALETVASNEKINLVLMDIMMPKMDGFEAMKRIRTSSNPRIKNIPVIALTAKAMREDHEKCIAAGANDYLPKPINLENLTTILRVWLSPKGLFA